MRSWTKRSTGRPSKQSSSRAIELAEEILGRLEALMSEDEVEARMALEREPKLIQAVEDAEEARDAALIQVAAHEALAVKHFKHLDMVRVELEKTKIELHKAQSTLRDIGAKIGSGT